MDDLIPLLMTVASSVDLLHSRILGKTYLITQTIIQIPHPNNTLNWQTHILILYTCFSYHSQSEGDLVVDILGFRKLIFYT